MLHSLVYPAIAFLTILSLHYPAIMVLSPAIRVFLNQTPQICLYSKRLCINRRMHVADGHSRCNSEKVHVVAVFHRLLQELLYRLPLDGDGPGVWRHAVVCRRLFHPW